MTQHDTHNNYDKLLPTHVQMDIGHTYCCLSFIPYFYATPTTHKKKDGPISSRQLHFLIAAGAAFEQNIQIYKGKPKKALIRITPLSHR
jgi:hypothetical protein